MTVSLALTNSGAPPTTNVVATLLSGASVRTPSGPQSYGVLTPGGSSASRQFTFTADGACGGTATLTLQLQDGASNLGTASFSFTLGRVRTNSVLTYGKTGLVSIPDTGPATPYPSTNVISGITGTLSKVTVTISNLTHSYPDDLDIVLVGPGGQAVMLMSDAGTSNGVNNITLTFDGAAGSPVPDESPIAAGTYRPADYEPGELFPSPAPTGPFGADLADFIGTNPNGVWRLFIYDDAAGDFGSISGWALSINSSEPFCCSGPPALAINRSGTNVLVTWPSSAQGYRLEGTNKLPPTLQANWPLITSVPVVQQALLLTEH